MNFDTRKLVVRYRRRHRAALDGVTMEVPSGSLFAVLGPNGSGKSTLMRALLGSVSFESGDVQVEGRSVSTWSRRELSRSVGAVTQSETVAFPLSVRELVSMGRYPHLGPLGVERADDRLAIEEALRRCEAGNLAEREVGTLSGGEFQRVRIARALAQRPRALILDEPTASLDIHHEMGILQLLRRSVDDGMTVVLITHQLNLAARFADRILLLDRGEVAAIGSVSEVLREEVLEEVYRWKLRVRRDPEAGYLTVTPLA